MGLPPRTLPRWQFDRVMDGEQRTKTPLEMLETQLQRQRARVDIHQLLDLWQHTDLVFTCLRPSGLEDAPDLAGRIRGALGHALKEAVEDHPHAFGLNAFGLEPVNPYELFYNWKPCAIAGPQSGLEASQPMTIRAEMNAKHVIVCLRLFGVARVHAPILSYALQRAVEGGIKLRNVGAGTHPDPIQPKNPTKLPAPRPNSVRISLPVIGAHALGFDGAAFVWGGTNARRATVRLRTPTIVRNKHQASKDPAAILRSMIRRAACIAPWFGCQLEADAGALWAAISELDIDAWLHEESWAWYSSREPGIQRRVEGCGGHMIVKGNLSLLSPYLRLAEFAHIGGSCAKGFGSADVTIDDNI